MDGCRSGISPVFALWGKGGGRGESMVAGDEGEEGEGGEGEL